MAPSRQAQAEASRGTLLRAATEVFTTAGYDQATVAEILRRAGMARGALYHYFPGGKREVFEAVFDQINEEYHRRRDALVALPDPLERIAAAMRVFLELCTDPGFARIALVDAPRVVPGQDQRGSSFRLLVSQLTEAQATGAARRFAVDSMALALYGAVRAAGEHVMVAIDPRSAVDEASATVALLVEGLRAR